MEPFLADFINNEKIPRIIRYTIVCLLCSFIIFLGVSISINSELLFGKILDKCRHLYINNITNVHKIIIYSMLYPTIMQFIIRGYMPMNIWMLFFLMLPVFLVSAISKIKIKL